MSRLIRVAPVGFPQHVIQRGNNRQVCFGSDEDLAAYMGWLKEYAGKYQVAIHAWVLMTNHVHLLATPYSESGISSVGWAEQREAQHAQCFTRKNFT